VSGEVMAAFDVWRSGTIHDDITPGSLARGLGRSWVISGRRKRRALRARCRQYAM